ncbi:GAF domain-containing protein [Miltoncostaea oceani]|uniref:GAF domain-containing protein n=1 Tax=Miltoncostaea oceani TaxID=2843216 RepID=UPI001C3E54EE|nr:GAF domain-containing protein [Miltoncostaea oceani]
MSRDGELRAAVAAAALGADEAHRELLDSVVQTARAIFGARASSVFLLDEPAGELVFAAVSGEGEADLIGRRFPAGTGIAGFTLASRQPLVLDDVSRDPRFSRAAAESTGYVPRGLMSVPLLRGDRAIGVLQVLDRQAGRFGLAEMELLGLFAGQAAAALDVLERARRARAVLDDGDDRLAAVARLAEALDRTGGRRGDAADRLLAALGDLMR